MVQGPEGQDDPDDRVAAPAEEALSRLGDIWTLGEHLIGCGDARDRAFLAKLMGSETAAVVFADPPFNCRIAGHVGGKGAVRHREFVMGSGEMAEEEFQAFQSEWLSAASERAAPGALLYVASDWRALYSALTAGRAAGLELFNLAVWEKTPGMGSFYRSAHELFAIWRKGGAPHRNNVNLGSNGRYRSNRWNYPSAAGFGPARADLHLHPTVKPIALVADVLLDCTKRRDVVLDPFSGSGSTMMAAQRTGRRARVVELDPRYVDVAIRRYQARHGGEARLVGSGLTLNDLAARPPRPLGESGYLSPVKASAQRHAKLAPSHKRRRRSPKRGVGA
jgi:DNA modification methylase